MKISGRRNCFAFSLLTETEEEEKNKTLNHLSLSAGNRELVLSKTGERCLLCSSTDCLLPEMLLAPLIKCTIFKNCTISPSPAFWFIDVKIFALVLTVIVTEQPYTYFICETAIFEKSNWDFILKFMPHQNAMVAEFCIFWSVMEEGGGHERKWQFETRVSPQTVVSCINNILEQDLGENNHKHFPLTVFSCASSDQLLNLRCFVARQFLS